MTLIERLRNHYYVTGTTDTDELIRETIARVEQLEAALRKIVTDGDYTAPEGMKRIAREVLGLTAEPDGGIHASHSMRPSIQSKTFRQVCDRCGWTDYDAYSTAYLLRECTVPETQSKPIREGDGIPPPLAVTENRAGK